MTDFLEGRIASIIRLGDNFHKNVGSYKLHAASPPRRRLSLNQIGFHSVYLALAQRQLLEQEHWVERKLDDIPLPSSPHSSTFQPSNFIAN
jgi:hypothetical protein